jgi:hypothetical protein
MFMEAKPVNFMIISEILESNNEEDFLHVNPAG